MAIQATNGKGELVTAVQKTGPKRSVYEKDDVTRWLKCIQPAET